MPTITDVRVYLTAGQLQYLGDPALKNAEGYEPGEKLEDTYITQVSDDGWIFVEQAGNVGEEGSGVWVDTEGYEHQGSMMKRMPVHEVVIKLHVNVPNEDAAHEYGEDMVASYGAAWVSIDVRPLRDDETAGE